MTMAHIFAVLAFMLLALALPFVLFLLILTVAALGWRRPKSLELHGAKAPDFVIVIPAHNEESSIVATIRNLKQIDYPLPGKTTILVIADNCTDNTESLAKKEGVTVWARADDVKRAKGYALEYAFDRLEKENAIAWDAAVVIDADTLVEPSLLRCFAWHLGRGGAWMQAYYSVSNPDTSWRTRLLTLAFALFNGVWLLGCDRLGLSVALRGNGMCFARKALRAHPWQAYGLAEDLEFSWWLRIWGQRVRFVAESAVYGEMASSLQQGAMSQRQRWESGRRQLGALFISPLLKSKCIGPLHKLAYLIDLYMPAMAKLALWLAGACVALMATYLTSGPDDPLVLGGLCLLIGMALTLVLYVSSPLVVWHLALRYLLAIFYFPLYVLWKIILFFHKKPTKWVRTPRAGE